TGAYTRRDDDLQRPGGFRHSRGQHVQTVQGSGGPPHQDSVPERVAQQRRPLGDAPATGMAALDEPGGVHRIRGKSAHAPRVRQRPRHRARLFPRLWTALRHTDSPRLLRPRGAAALRSALVSEGWSAFRSASPPADLWPCDGASPPKTRHPTTPPLPEGRVRLPRLAAEADGKRLSPPLAQAAW